MLLLLLSSVVCSQVVPAVASVFAAVSPAAVVLAVVSVVVPVSPAVAVPVSAAVAVVQTLLPSCALHLLVPQGAESHQHH